MQTQNIYFSWPLSWGATEKEEAMGLAQGIQPRIEDEGLPGMMVSWSPRWQHEAGLDQTALTGVEESSIKETNEISELYEILKHLKSDIKGIKQMW